MNEVEKKAIKLPYLIFYPAEQTPDTRQRFIENQQHLTDTDIIHQHRHEKKKYQQYTHKNLGHMCTAEKKSTWQKSFHTYCNFL